MKIKKDETGARVRSVLAGMATDRTVLAAVAAWWDDKAGMLGSPWADAVGTWCVDYYRRYGKAPGRDLEGLYEAWAESADEDTAGLVGKFLEDTSDEWSKEKPEAHNSQRLLDLAGDLFNHVRAERLATTITGHLALGKPAKALETIDKFRRIEVGAGQGIDVLRDKEAMRRAFEARQDPLIRMPGALGNFYADFLERDGFVAFMGPEKVGKTFVMMDLCWRAMLQGRKVGFFQTGDLSEAQILRRIGVRAAKRPLRPTEPDKPVRFPRYLTPGSQPGDPPEVDFEERHFKGFLTWQKAFAACERVAGKIGSEECLLRLSVHSNSSISVDGIRAAIDGWDRQGWMPDVVVVDYADILAPPPGFSEARDGVNATWARMRRLSQDIHGLMVTATQTNRASYAVETITKAETAEDKRKLAHVTGMVGINRTPAEKPLQVTRFNWVVLREGELSDDQCVTVAGCLAVGNPCVLSSF